MIISLEDQIVDIFGEVYTFQSEYNKGISPPGIYSFYLYPNHVDTHYIDKKISEKYERTFISFDLKRNSTVFHNLKHIDQMIIITFPGWEENSDKKFVKTMNEKLDTLDLI